MSRITGNTKAVSQATFRRRRAMLSLVLAMLLTAGVSMLSTYSAEATSSSGASEFDYVTVTSGTTLWGLAQAHAQDSDPREWIAELVTLNALNDGILQPGQRLALPAN